MSTTVDQRVVEMQFDNKQFERNVSTTMSSLDKLKQSLNLTGASKGLENVGAAAKGINLSGLTSAAETVGLKFNAMWTIADQALRNITNSAYYAGKRIVDSLTIEPVKMGFQEYETQIKSVQTILANTSHNGTTLEQVNGALDELNTYADKTIYNFTEMTRNIGTFTAAGLGLDDSVSAIKGIANLAAVSGSTSQQASTAMYQLSQALANGKVNLQDWNSVVNAGMGGKVFQDALVRTAAAMKGVTEETFRANNITGSFRESLSSKDGGGWLTTDVLSKTLQQFTGDMTDAELAAIGFNEAQIKSIQSMAVNANDAATKVKTVTQLWDTLKETAQSGWTQTWELIVGDFEEAKSLFSGIYNSLSPMLEASSKSRNDFLGGVLKSNWDKMIDNINEAGISTTKFEETLRSAMESHGLNVDSIIAKHGSLEKAFRSGALSTNVLKEALGTLSGAMVDLSSIERTLEKGLTGDDIKLAQEALKNLGHDLGSAGVDGIFGSKTEEAVKAFQELKGLEVTGIVDEKTLSALQEANKSTINLVESCKDFVSTIKKLSGREKIMESFKNVFEGILNIVKPIKEAFRNIFPPTTVEQVVGFIDRFRELTINFKEFTSSNGDKIRTTFEGIFSVLDIGWEFIKQLAGGIKDLIGKFSGLGGGILDTTSNIGEWLTNIRDTIKETDIFGVAIDKIVGFLSKGIDKIKEFGRSIKGVFDSPGVQGFYNIMSGIWDIITKIGSKLGEIFAPLGQAIANVFNNASFSDILNDGIFAGVLVGIYKFVDNLNGPLGSIKDMFDGIAGEDGIIGGLKDTLDSVRGCFEAYQQSLQAETIKKIAVAIAILAAAIFVISSIDGDKLDHSLGAVTILFGELIGSLAVFNKVNSGSKGLVKSVAAITGLATALLILSGAMKIMSTMSWSEIAVGITGTVVGLGALVGAVNLLPEKNTIKSAKAIGKLATALVILAAGMKIMASMSWQELGVAVTGVVVGLGALVAAVNLLPKDAALRSMGMIGLATAMVILGGALKIMGSLSWDEIGRGLAAMAGSLIAIVGAMNLMTSALPGAAAMLIVAPALIILAGALKIMGSMSWEEIGKGLVALAGSLLILAGAMTLMVASLPGAAAMLVIAPALLILAAALKVMGSMSWGEIGKSLVMLAGAFAVIGVAGLLLTPVIPAILGLAAAILLLGVATVGIGAGLLLIGTGISALSAALAVGTTAIVAGLSAIIMGIVDLIPNIVLGLGEGILALCTVIKECAPAIVETLFVLLAEVCTSLATYVPVIASALFDLLIGALNVLADKMPDLIQAAMNVIGAFFKGIVDALKGMDASSLMDGIVGAGLLTALILALSALAPLIPGAMLGVLGMGAVIAEMALVLAAIGALAQIPGLSWLIGEGGDLLQQIGTAIGQFVGGLIGGIAEGATSTLPQVGSNLSDFMTNLTPFINGMQAIDSAVLDNAKALASAILTLTAADLLSGIASFFSGGKTLADFGTEIAEFGKAMKKYSAEVAGLDTNAVTTSVNAAKDLVKLTRDIPSDGLFGTDGIDDFGKNLVKFGKRMKEYGAEVADIDKASISASVTAAKDLVEVAGNIPDDGTFGGDGIDDFGKNIYSFAKSLKNYSDKIDEVNISSITKSASTVRNLINIINSMVGLDSSGVDSFKKAVNSLAKVNFEGLTKTFAASKATLINVGKDMFSSILDGAKSVKTKFISVTQDIINVTIQVVKAKSSLFKAAGMDIINMLITGVISSKARVSLAFASAVSTALSVINGYRGKFYSAGAYLVSGFASGISANRYKAAAQARAMAEAAANAARKELDEHSPSRVGYEIGDFFGIAFVNAIADNVKKAYDASAMLANASKSGLKNAFEKVSRIISGEVDVNPTIKPVLDLTNVRSGANAINGMFSLQPSVGVLANIGAVNSMMNQRSQNYGNDDVVAAINKLRKDIGNVGGTTYSIGGITYEDGSAVSKAIETLVREVKVGRRV